MCRLTNEPVTKIHFGKLRRKLDRNWSNQITWLNTKMLDIHYSKTISQMIRLRSHIASIWRKLDDFLKSIAYDFGSLLSSRFIAVKKRLLVITIFNAKHILVSSFTSKTFKFTVLKVWSISWNLHELKRYFIIWRCWIRWNFGPV